ncbi:MAG: glycoside hydrolase family 15 protein [Candidatus Omnitrophica bacterium]|nr:glycoside hydrolase family 15 protein [Candidatus Omnitrophota bacterium]
MKTYPFGIIGNCTSAALISTDCSIEWMCLPFFDSPSLFARLIDQNKGGHFKITAQDIVTVKQNYIPNTAILKTIFETKHGVFEVSDYMPRFHAEHGIAYCPSEIHRDIHVISGKPRLLIDLNPRPNYASSQGRFDLHGDYIKIHSVGGEYNSFYLYTNLDHQKVISGEPIEINESSYFLLSYHEKLEKINLNKIYVEYEKTKSYWLDWAYRTKVPTKYREMVIRSTITLKLLMYQRTGAVIAAPTTSLPEIIGGERNWDYRYCWVRDASMMIDLFTRLGHIGFADQYIRFILRQILLKHENITVMYGINGQHELPEITLDHLDGYEGSKPVRIGNAAYSQIQNDLYGELIEMIYTYLVLNAQNKTSYLNEEIWTAVRTLVNYVRNTWKKPDAGIWERRGEPQHYTHSKMMSWVAMDRAGRIALHLGRTQYAEACFKTAAEIREDILKNGWSDQSQAFVMNYGSHDMDAAVLLMLHYGFLPPTDERMISTVKKMYESLVRNHFMMRYIAEDDFGAPRNAFLICTFWMINALYLIGEEKKAREMFAHVVQYRNIHGLFSEGIEIESGRLVGNFPQGYSHLALIQTILLLETDYNWMGPLTMNKDSVPYSGIFRVEK